MGLLWPEVGLRTLKQGPKLKWPKRVVELIVMPSNRGGALYAPRIKDGIFLLLSDKTQLQAKKMGIQPVSAPFLLLWPSSI